VRTICTLAALPLAALMACSPPADPPADVPDPAEAERLAAIERLMGLETCADAEQNYGGLLPQLTSCRLELGDGQPSFVISSDTIIASDTESMGTLRAELAGETGASLQLIEERVESAFSYPQLQDVDGNGRPDLLIPLYTAMVNTNYALWLHGADGLFTRAGELSGHSIDLSPEGFIAATGRSSAAEQETIYYRLSSGALEEAAVVVNRMTPEEGEPPLEGPACEVTRTAEGVDPAGFCAPPG
jgi:hypothetical protein